MMHLFVNAGRKYSRIHRNIYGHFAEHLGRGIYQGIFVGEDSPIPNVRGIRTDVVQALRQIKAPVLRWPGGCFAEYYDWRDGIGPTAGRKRIMNASWGGVVEDNTFGTHEFLDLCGQVGCAPYIAGNVGTGTPREASEWVEYLTFDGQSSMADLRRANGQKDPWEIDFLGIGNENWACGGNMRAAYYADVYRQFATFIRQYGKKPIHKIACGPDGDDFEWTDVLMRMAAAHMDGLSLHYYTMPGYYACDPFPEERKGRAVGVDANHYYRTLRRALYMDDLIRGHKAVMDRYDPQKRVDIVVDEWGAWHQAEPGTNPAFLYQQNTMRDALVAAVTLNIFNLHSDRVRMANLAQMVNVLQSVILTEGEEMVLTPTYHVFELYKGHQDATLIESHVQQDITGSEEAQVPVLHASASQNREGEVHITVANLSATEPQELSCLVVGKDAAEPVVRMISGDVNAHNAFGAPPSVFVRDGHVVDITNDRFMVQVPPCSVLEIVV